MRAVMRNMLILGAALAAAGCQGALADGLTAGTFAANLRTFLADFARQALAAWLL